MSLTVDSSWFVAGLKKECCEPIVQSVLSKFDSITPANARRIVEECFALRDSMRNLEKIYTRRVVKSLLDERTNDVSNFVMMISKAAVRKKEFDAQDLVITGLESKYGKPAVTRVLPNQDTILSENVLKKAAEDLAISIVTDEDKQEIGRFLTRNGIESSDAKVREICLKPDKFFEIASAGLEAIKGRESPAYRLAYETHVKKIMDYYYSKTNTKLDNPAEVFQYILSNPSEIEELNKGLAQLKKLYYFEVDALEKEAPSDSWSKTKVKPDQELMKQLEKATTVGDRVKILGGLEERLTLSKNFWTQLQLRTISHKEAKVFALVGNAYSEYGNGFRPTTDAIYQEIIGKLNS